MTIDNDEQLERMCKKCAEEVTSTNICSRCGKNHSDNEEVCTNTNFDMEKFNKLKAGG